MPPPSPKQQQKQNISLSLLFCRLTLRRVLLKEAPEKYIKKGRESGEVDEEGEGQMDVTDDFDVTELNIFEMNAPEGANKRIPVFSSEARYLHTHHSEMNAGVWIVCACVCGEYA